MNDRRDDGLTKRAALWGFRAVVSFAVGIVTGSVCIPIVQFLVNGDVDPFTHGWPLCLEASALLMSAIMAFGVKSRGVLPIGVYVGLVGLMLASGKAEYPVASAIALAVHGFVPAAIGTAISSLVLSSRSHRSPRTAP